ncbi:hypothetical protein ThidrDRAFT_2185 [Thiorhodococcus drewsii AZ1]|uniref:Type II secretion system protein GspC N-terminal domain-containing protein n=1 Tax=Thiorhodococcus drewsii AZ1 TaxID=765913 RepID=G2E1M2_9GAMM|nr:hypothetical protein [Thiorhodococcus drewsii]EGV31319.1 hypothetical protein ThidrDRAFT_2185 [Thiorhodococcus drewsii AZ1]
MTKLIPGILLFLLLAVLALQWKSWPPTAPVAKVGDGSSQPAQPSSTDPSQPNPLEKLKSLEDKDTYANVLERPLFRPDRRPLPPEEDVPDEPSTPDNAVELDTVDLTAVLISPALVSAWIRDPAQPKLVRLRIGDEYSGWSVQQIQEDRVLMERQGEEHALRLRDYSKASPTAPARVPSKQRPSPIKTRKRAAPNLRR